MSDEKFWCVVNDTRNNTSWTRTTTTCQTKQTTRRVGGGRATRRTTTKKISVKKWTDEKFFRATYDTRRQKLDEENYEKFQCDIDDTRDDSSRGRGAIRGVRDDQEDLGEEVGAQVDRRKVLSCDIRHERRHRNLTRRTGATWSKAWGKKKRRGRGFGGRAQRRVGDATHPIA